MLISTKGRYALRVMLELAVAEEGTFVSLASVAQKEDISVKYLESIVAMLVRAGLVEGARGKGGGYRLERAPSEYRVGQILRAAEGSLAPVACLDCKPNACTRAEGCKTLPLWQKLDDMINGYLDSVTLKDLL